MRTTDIRFLSIAGFTIKIVLQRSENDHLQRLMQENIRFFYKDFYRNATKKVDASIVIIDDSRQEIVSRAIEEKYYINFYRRIDGNTLETYYHVSPIHFQMILRSVLEDLLRKDGGFFLHASASLMSGACVFLGLSGAGKSTASQLLKKKYPVLADDILIVRKKSDSYYLYQTPLLQKNPVDTQTKRGIKLKKIFFLRKAREFKLEKLNESELLKKKLMKQCHIAEKNCASQVKLVDNLVEEKGMFYELTFDKDHTKMINFFKSLNT